VDPRHSVTGYDSLGENHKLGIVSETRQPAVKARPTDCDAYCE